MGMPSSASPGVLSRFRALTLLAVALLAAHAPLFLNDGVVMDDWLLLKLRPDYPIDLSPLIRGAGHPVFFGYFSFANMTGAPVTVMVIMTVLAILAGAV